MDHKFRAIGSSLKAKLTKPFVHILFGARQTGKSTLIRGILPADATLLDLSDPRERARFAANPGLFIDLCRALPASEGARAVFVDEAQTVPAIFDAVQSLYDGDKEGWRFILCGSSARPLRVSGANLLPGRSMRHVLHPLITQEYEAYRAAPKGELPSLLPSSAEEAASLPGKKARSRHPPLTLRPRAVQADRAPGQ